MKLRACRSLRLRPVSGVWFRAIQPQYWRSCLKTAQTKIYPGRFHAPRHGKGGFEVLYLAENSLVALLETEAVFGSLESGSFFSHPHLAWIVLNVELSLQHVADLTDSLEQAKLETSAQELTGDWIGYQKHTTSTSIKGPGGLAPTQQLGAALYKLPRLEAFQTVSSKLAVHRNLVVFPQKLLPGSGVVFHHPATGQKHSLP